VSFLIVPAYDSDCTIAEKSVADAMYVVASIPTMAAP
jgi:hypothetical protein